MPTAPPESVETLIEQGRVLLEEGDFRRAILCFRRAQAMAPFRKDVRLLMADAIDGRLASAEANLEQDFRDGDFAETRSGSRVGGQRRRRSSSGMTLAFLLRVAIGVITLVFAIVLINLVRDMMQATPAPGIASELGPAPPSPATSPAPVPEGSTSSGTVTAPAGATAPVTPSISAPPSPPGFAELLQEARTVLAGDRYSDALALLEQARAAEGADASQVESLTAELYSRRGRQRYEAGSYAQALEDYQQADAHRPNDAETQYSLGWCHHALGRERRTAGNESAATDHFRQARQAFERSISLDPNLAKSYRSLGQTLILLNDREGAFQAWRRTIEIDPQSRDAERARNWLQSYNVSVPQ